MSSLKSSGEGLPGFENDASSDSNPYAYPYFHCTQGAVFDLVVKFAGHWNEVTNNDDDDDAATFMELRILVKQIQLRCATRPMEASWKDSCGDTALHRLCQVARFPLLESFDSMVAFARLLVQVAQALVEAHPGSATTATNNWKETPLHQFCSHCAFSNSMNVGGNDDDVDIVIPPNVKNPMMDLLELLSRDNACSLRNCWGSFPLHDACGLPGWEISLDTAIWNRNPSQDGPLLVSWMKQQHVTMIQYLISQHAKAVRLRVERDETPLYRALSSYKCSIDVIKLLLSYHDGRDSTLNSSLPALWKHYPSGSLEDAWAETFQHGTLPFDYLFRCNDDESQLKAREVASAFGLLWTTTELVFNKIASSPTQIIHAAVSTRNCPQLVVQLTMLLYPEQSLLQDENGSTPLILAIANQCSGDVVNSVLQANPKAASIPDNNGRLPLCHAIATKRYSYRDVLYPLFVAHPSATTTRDPVTSLFPFSLAAAANVSAVRQTERDQVSTIYELLRIDPVVLTLQ